MSKRLLSALVAFCMALTLMPSWALADEPADDGPSEDPAAVETPAEPEEDEEESSDASLPEEPDEEEIPTTSVAEVEIIEDADPLDNDKLFEDFLNVHIS